MATSKKSLHEALRARYMEKIKSVLEAEGEEVLRTNSNEFSVPCVDDEGNDEFLVLVFKIPTGSRDGEAYDGYGMAQDYEMHQAEKAEKAEKAKAEKEKKIARDKAQREAKAKAKAEYNAKKTGQ